MVGPDAGRNLADMMDTLTSSHSAVGDFPGCDMGLSASDATSCSGVPSAQEDMAWRLDDTGAGLDYIVSEVPFFSAYPYGVTMYECLVRGDGLTAAAFALVDSELPILPSGLPLVVPSRKPRSWLFDKFAAAASAPSLFSFQCAKLVVVALYETPAWIRKTLATAGAETGYGVRVGPVFHMVPLAKPAPYANNFPASAGAEGIIHLGCLLSEVANWGRVFTHLAPILTRRVGYGTG